MDDRKLSKALSYYLRHAPHELGLQLQPGGWVEQAELLDKLQAQGIAASPADLQRVTATSDKQRFAMEGSRIRANQGHSTPVDLELLPQVPPALLYHGTPQANLPSIFEQGLLKGQRHHVHLSQDPDTAAKVGERRGKPVILHVHAQSMHEQGHQFFCSANGVWLTERVPPQFLQAPPATT
ncbi:RNA 2'-phosphotransferase [bacterium SCN 62-11]|nr:RNA 2'-phosphotransferase [Candidatus Eremiobacteraeota bacterium]ODT64569.1 MAG: RNA 2'-phosphotransferase [bacterium SCN 62-11]